MNTSRWIIAFLGLGLSTLFACEVTSVDPIDWEGSGGDTGSGTGGTTSSGTTSSGTTSSGTTSSGTTSSGTVGGDCPTGQTCTQVTDTGAMGCLEGENIPAGAQTGCDTTPCNGNYSCFCIGDPCTGANTVCVGNCGTCPTGQTCTQVTDTGAMGCLEGENIPAGAQTGCDATPCNGNYSCFCIGDPCTGANAICVGNCS